MKRDFISNLLKDKLIEGTDLKEIIDAIIDENSVDIGKAKGDLENAKEQVKTLTSQLNERDSQLEKLKSVDVDKLNGEIERLQAENKAAKAESDRVISEMRRNGAVRDKLHAAQAKDIDMVMKLLDLAKVAEDKDGNLTGIDEQIKALTEGELTKGWFGNKPALPTGAEPTPGAQNPTQKKISEMSYTELDEFMRANPDVDISKME